MIRRQPRIEGCFGDGRTMAEVMRDEREAEARRKTQREIRAA